MDREYLYQRVKLILVLLDEQMTVLSEYIPIELDLIERTWDSQIKRMAYYMGISNEMYDTISWFYLDEYIKVGDRVIVDIDELVDYLMED